MNAKTLKILVVVTLVVVLAAVAAQQLTGVGRDGEELPERVVPGLADRVNDVAAIEIADAERTVTLERREGGWAVTSLAGYPAKFETVKQAVVSLAELEPRERKTADPARYARIGLADPGEGAESVRAVLRDEEGGEIASVVLGDTVQEGGSSQRYVRTGSDPQAWLAEGRVDVPTDPMMWVEREIVRIPRDQVTRITITHPEGEVVSIAREQGGTGYALETIPEGRQAKSPGEIGGPASALSYLRFDDVRSAADPGFDKADQVVTVYETSEGLRLTVTSWRAEEKTWATFDVEPVESAAAEQAAPEDQAETPEEAPSETTGDPGDEAQTEAQTEAQAEADVAGAQQQAAELDARLTGWVFAIPGYQAESLRKRLEDLTEVPAPAEEIPAEESGDEEEPLLIPTLDARDDPGGGGNEGP